MRLSWPGLQVAVALVLLATGCAGQPSLTGTAPAATPAATHTAPLLAADVTGGVPVELGSAGHWAIAAGRAFVVTAEGEINSIDLASGTTRWQASFGLGQAWDAQPTIGLSSDAKTVIALRTVDMDATPSLDLLTLDAETGTGISEDLIVDPHHRWQIDLPPRILAADAETVVLADNPESGYQTAVIDRSTATLVWQASEEAVAAGSGTVITRASGRARASGTRLWEATTPLGPLLAQTEDVAVVTAGGSGIWLDPATGAELARTDPLGEAEPPCRPATSALICVGAGVIGYDLATGEQLWSSPEPAEWLATVADWVYLGRAQDRGDILDASTGEVLASDAELPAIRYADETGILVAAEGGYSWVPLVR